MKINIGSRLVKETKDLLNDNYSQLVVPITRMENIRNREYNISGNFLTVTRLLYPARIRFNSPSAPEFQLEEGQVFSISFHKIYITVITSIPTLLPNYFNDGLLLTQGIVLTYAMEPLFFTQRSNLPVESVKRRYYEELTPPGAGVWTAHMVPSLFRYLKITSVNNICRIYIGEIAPGAGTQGTALNVGESLILGYQNRIDPVFFSEWRIYYFASAAGQLITFEMGI